jgi:uncharacterized protein YbjT (DUF2867 family)
VRILVTGATGYVGSRLVTALLANRHRVVAATRNPKRLKRLGWFDDIAPVTLDASDPVSVRAAFASSEDAVGPVDVVYYLVHGIGQPGFRDADRAAATNVAIAARDAGVRRIVYLGGFVPAGEDLSEHLTSRAELAEALTVDDGPELVWLGAAMLIGAGSTSFEMRRCVGDRFPVMPIPSWMDNPIDPISIRDLLHCLAAAADPGRVPAGAYDISGSTTTSYRELLKGYARISGRRHAALPVGIDDAIAVALADRSIPGPRPVNALTDPHHLADSDPASAGGDALRIRRLARAITPPIARPTLRLVDIAPDPLAGALRTGPDILFTWIPKGRPA